MRKVAVIAVLVVAGVISPGGPAVGDEESSLPTSVAEGLDRHGFAVGRVPVRSIAGVYRGTELTVFVTADSVIGVYYTLARRVIGGLGDGVNTTLGPWLCEWDEAVRDQGSGETGRVARAYTATLRSLCTRPPLDLDDEVRGTVNRRLARLRGERMFTVPEPWEAGTRDAELRLALVWKNGLTTPGDRFDTAVHWITRMKLPASRAGGAARNLLAATIPAALKERVSAPFEWIGLARARFPGGRTVIAIEVPGDQRFPPATLPDHAHVFGLDLGRRLGSSLAGKLLEDDPIMERALPAGHAAPVPGSLSDEFESVLSTMLDTPDPRAPELFSTTAWQILALQSALAGHALFRRAAGPFCEPCRVFGGGTKHAGLVHPDPAFFSAIAKLAERTAEDARQLGTDTGPKGAWVRAEVLDALEAHLKGKKALSAEHLAALRTRGHALQDVESLGTELDTREFRGRMLKTVLPFLRQSAAENRNALALWRPAATFLDQLAGICRRFGAAAKAQLAGREIEDAEQLFLHDWPTLLMDVERPRASEEDLYCAAVAALEGSGVRLWQGSAGFRLLYLRYPVNGKPVLARGAVLVYREHLAKEWLDDSAWCDLVERGIPQLPIWAR